MAEAWLERNYNSTLEVGTLCFFVYKRDTFFFVQTCLNCKFHLITFCINHMCSASIVCNIKRQRRTFFTCFPIGKIEEVLSKLFQQADKLSYLVKCDGRKTGGMTNLCLKQGVIVLKQQQNIFDLDRPKDTIKALCFQKKKMGCSEYPLLKLTLVVSVAGHLVDGQLRP